MKKANVDMQSLNYFILFFNMSNHGRASKGYNDEY